MKHIAYINTRPERSGLQSTPDGAINGNGDLCVILGNSEKGMRIYIAKCDMWYGVEKHNSGGIKPLGIADIDIPAELYKNYRVEQDMDKGELRCRFENTGRNCSFTVRVCKTENTIMLENTGNVEIQPELRVFPGKTDGKKGMFEADGCKGIFRELDGADCLYVTCGAAVIKKVAEGKWVITAATNHDGTAPRKRAVNRALAIDENEFEALKSAHYAAWQKFYSASAFSLSDETLENGWYASQYLLASCAGNEKFPPGIFGNFITVEYPSWRGDYHLNYNYQAPFYAACSSNHPELTDCYHAPLEQFYEKGRDYAKRFGCRGIMYPVGIAPGGIATEVNYANKYWFLRLFLGQKSNAIHPADIMVFRWRATRDKEYARLHAYPYVKACLEFFEDYLIKENGRYSVCRDAAHEVPYYKDDFNPRKYSRYINDKNNALTLGALRLCLPAAVDMAKELGVDEDKQKKWSEMLENLSPFATYYRYFKKVYRYTEKGQMWNDGNDVGQQHIYPMGCIGLSSPEKELKIARSTFNMKAKTCWKDDNAVCSFYPMAARLGIDPGEITYQLHDLVKTHMLPNMLFLFAGGCLEDCSVFASTLNEMALQSHQDIIRIFPCWNKNIDAEFTNLRADGAFLVCASIKNGKTGKISIKSAAGQPLRLLNPFARAQISVNGKVSTTEEKIIVIPTRTDDIITVEQA